MLSYGKNWNIFTIRIIELNFVHTHISSTAECWQDSRSEFYEKKIIKFENKSRNYGIRAAAASSFSLEVAS